MDIIGITQQISKLSGDSPDVVELCSQLEQVILADSKYILITIRTRAAQEDWEGVKVACLTGKTSPAIKESTVLRNGMDALSEHANEDDKETFLRNLLTLENVALADLPKWCGGRNRRCSKCYEKYFVDGSGDRWHCPSCGFPRRLCRRRPGPGADRCTGHGGPATKMISNPYSRRREGPLKGRRIEKWYKDALADPKTLSLMDEIALLDAFINKELQKLPHEDGVDLYMEMDAAMREVRSMSTDGTMDEMREFISDIKGEMEDSTTAKEMIDSLKAHLARVSKAVKYAMAVYNEISGEDDVWIKVIKAIEVRARLVGEERRMIIDSQKVVTPIKFMEFVESISESIKGAINRHIEDPATIRSIQSEYLTDLKRLMRGGRKVDR